MVGKTIRSPDLQVTTATERVLNILTQLSSWIDEIPPVTQQQRFGNKAYKTWHERLVKEADSLTRYVLADLRPDASVELAAYLSDSFGNATRIDYGTGHEMAFVVYLCSLFMIGLWTDEDRPAVGLKVFSRYVPPRRTISARLRVLHIEPFVSDTWTCAANSKIFTAWNRRARKACGTWTITSSFRSSGALPR